MPIMTLRVALVSEEVVRVRSIPASNLEHALVLLQNWKPTQPIGITHAGHVDQLVYPTELDIFTPEGEARFRELNSD